MFLEFGRDMRGRSFGPTRRCFILESVLLLMKNEKKVQNNVAEKELVLGNIKQKLNRYI